MAVSFRTVTFWVVKVCSLVHGQQHFRAIWYLQFLGQNDQSKEAVSLQRRDDLQWLFGTVDGGETEQLHKDYQEWLDGIMRAVF
jgi:hypothetical protein